MAQPVFYQTLNMIGVDPTLYYTNLATAGGSITPEYPAAPFVAGIQAFGSDGSQFVFVQASTSISLTDFVMINIGSPGGGTYMANSITNTNVASSLPVGIGSAGLVLKQSVTFIPAGAFFWALTRGQLVPATTSNGLGTNTGTVPLYTSATAGVLTSVSSASAAAFAGIIVVNSLTVSIPSSVVPPAGGTISSTGFTVGPVVNINLPRLVALQSSGTGAVSLQQYGF